MSGWSSASYWGLTDQLFNTHWVFTQKRVPKSIIKKGSHSYLLVHTSQVDFIGTTYEWFGAEKILIADPHQTVIDFLNNPDIFGTYGMVDIMQEYLHSSHADLSKLVHYAGLMKNRSIFKRLGFLLEYFKIDAPDIIEACARQISKGQSQLSAKTLGDVYLKKWHLYVPSNMVIQ
jgi:predicted transcriptional regulator of viral defense system